MLCMPTTNPDIATKFWALSKNRSHRILHLITMLLGKEVRRCDFGRMLELQLQEVHMNRLSLRIPLKLREANGKAKAIHE